MLRNIALLQRAFRLGIMLQDEASIGNLVMLQKTIRYPFLFTLFLLFSACRTVSTPEPSLVPGLPDAIPGMTRLELDTSGLYESPSWSPDGQFLAYSRTEFILPGLNPSSAEIYVIDLTTGQLTQVTNNNEIDLEPDWSSDGTSIVFIRRSIDYPKKMWIVIMESDGSDQRVLLECPKGCGSPVWSPDGALIAFVMNADDDSWPIWLIKPDGTDLRRIESQWHITGEPDWSPSSDWLAYNCSNASERWTDADLCVLDLATGEESILLMNEGPKNPNWSPDDTYILFSAGRYRATAPEKWTLFTINVSNGSKHRLISEDLNYDIFDAAWSPDGSKIAFAFGSITGTSSLYILDLTQLSE